MCVCVTERSSLRVSVWVRHCVVSLRRLFARMSASIWMANDIKLHTAKSYQSNANTSHALQSIHSKIMHLPEKGTLITQDFDLNKWEIQMGKNSRLMTIHHYCASKNHKRYMDFCAWDGIKLYHYKTSSSSSRFWCFKDNSIEYNPKFPGIKSSNEEHHVWQRRHERWIKSCKVCGTWVDTPTAPDLPTLGFPCIFCLNENDLKNSYKLYIV